jgi:hypothetical protein
MRGETTKRAAVFAELDGVSLLDAVTGAGEIPDDKAPQARKKRYSEVLSANLAVEVAAGLRSMGFSGTKPIRGGPGEKAFQGGLGPKKVDVSFSDERHGLLLAISIKSINFAPFGKNLANRFGDLCTEAINLHMRFPYSVVCALFAMPVAANEDITPRRVHSTFQRASRVFATISGRTEYTDPPEKFEHIAMMLFQPAGVAGAIPNARLFDSSSQEELTKDRYLTLIRQVYNRRNPHALIEEPDDDEI